MTRRKPTVPLGLLRTCAIQRAGGTESHFGFCLGRSRSSGTSLESWMRTETGNSGRHTSRLGRKTERVNWLQQLRCIFSMPTTSRLQKCMVLRLTGSRRPSCSMSLRGWWRSHRHCLSGQRSQQPPSGSSITAMLDSTRCCRQRSELSTD